MCWPLEKGIVRAWVLYMIVKRSGLRRGFSLVRRFCYGITFSLRRQQLPFIGARRLGCGAAADCFATHNRAERDKMRSEQEMIGALINATW
jgi:hypothetical protein